MFLNLSAKLTEYLFRGFCSRYLSLSVNHSLTFYLLTVTVKHCLFKVLTRFFDQMSLSFINSYFTTTINCINIIHTFSHSSQQLLTIQLCTAGKSEQSSKFTNKTSDSNDTYLVNSLNYCIDTISPSHG